MRRLFTDEQEKYILDNYKTMPYADIASHLGFTERQVRGRINGLGLKKRDRQYNKNYFKIIDTPDKAYWLGFIYADGWIINNTNAGTYELGIELQRKDRRHLEKFSEAIGGNFKIVDKHQFKRIAGAYYTSETFSSVIRIYSKSIVKDLIRHGVVERKTASDMYPQVDQYFIDFLRGYIDGDGCLYFDKIHGKDRMTVAITSSNEKGLTYICEKLKQEYNVNSRVYKLKDRKYRLIVYRAEDVDRILGLLYYSDDVVCLSRKLEKYKTYLGLAA